jgi:phosphatidylglycerophosphatase A
MKSNSTWIQKTMYSIATGFGLGRMPKAPGTWGTLLGLPLAWAFQFTGTFGYMVLTFLMAAIGIFAAEMYERAKGSHDSSEIVIDEVVGMLITLTWLPFNFITVILGFALFRFFDILKPFPISWLDRKVPGGIGVMADDMVAGVIANIILQIIYTETAWLGSQWVQ